MPPQGPEHPGCNCRPVRPCFESIQQLVARARNPPNVSITEEFSTRRNLERDVRDPDPELDIVPTVDCTPPQQATESAKYPGARCSEENKIGNTGADEKQDTAQIEQNLQAVAKENCPCNACLHGAIFEDCTNPFIEIEKKYLEALKRGKEPSKDFFPDEEPSHDCHTHRDRPRDRAPGDPDSDFEPKTCKSCPCCLSFRPHPPATLATPDLYRTCGLPKRFQYPAWFHGYGNNEEHPMYRTTYSDIGRYPPSVHTVPTVYHPIDSSTSNLFAKIGPYRDRSLRTSGSIWDAYTYYDFS